MAKFYSMRLVKLFCTLFFLWYCFSIKAEEAISVGPFTRAIEFDGMPEEEAWHDATLLPLTMHTPVFGQDPSEQSEVLLGYDDDYLYLAGRLFDADPTKIMANTKKRDAMVGSTDWFGIVIDSYNDFENGLAFFTNPNGLRLDVNVFNDAIGDMPKLKLEYFLGRKNGGK